MAEKFTVKEKDKLLNFLFSNLTGWSKKTIKQRLKSATVAVNGKITTKHDFPLDIDDIVEIGVTKKTSLQVVKKLLKSRAKTQFLGEFTAIPVGNFFLRTRKFTKSPITKSEADAKTFNFFSLL